MSETDLQYGGGYVYQWECALLLALNYFFEPVRYDPTLFDLVQDFLGEVAEMQLEGEDRQNGVELEDINLIKGNRRILIQVKTKQAEGKPWTLADPLLLKALYRFYESRFSAEEPDNVRFVFLTNRPFNGDLVRVKSAIKRGAVSQCTEAGKLYQQLARYAEREKRAGVESDHLYAVLGRTALVEYLSVDGVKANVQAKLQAYGRPDWKEAHALLFEYFTRQSTRVGGGVVTRDSVAEVLGPPCPRAATLLTPYAPPPPPAPDTIPDPGPLPPGFRIPFQRNALFTGRVEPLQALARALLEGDGRSALVTQAVAGMGGVGKTQLAVEFAHRYGRFFHGVHWVNAGEPEGMGAEVAACGAAMGLPDWPEKQPEQVARTLSEWQRGGPRLVVLDNLEQVGAAREWLARLSGGAVRVLVTARRTDWPGFLGLRQLRLESFTPEESRAFLRQHLPDGRATEADLQALAERLYHLPLALELAGRYLAGHPRLSVSAYLERLEAIWEHPSMAGWREELESPTEHDLRLAETFAVSWERVEDGTARRVFLLAGYCAPNQPIPCEVLEEAAGIEREACDEALGVLTGLGLLEMGEPEAGPTVHPLLAEYGRAIVPSAPGGKGVLGTLADALARLAREASHQMDQTGSPSHFAPLLPHVRLVAERAEEERLEKAAILWGDLGYYLRRVADYVGARAAHERALAIDERTYGPDHPEVAADVNNLGSVLRDLGDLAGARVAYERALAIDERVLGSDHPNVATLVNNLGLVLKDLGDLVGARAVFERALAIDERAFGPDHPSVARDVNNLGLVLKDLGDLAGARAAYERALEIGERAFGPDHPNVAIFVNNLGGVLRELGELAGARAALERALAIDERAYGPDHPKVAIRVNNLGSVLQDLGDLAGARAAYERALAIDERAFGPDHPNVARDVNNLGMVLRDLGELVGARAAFERALAIGERAFGSEHPQVAIFVNNLGLVLRALEDLAGARAAYERALAIAERAFGPDHPKVATAVNNLGSVLQALGDLAGARAAFERALAIDERAFGPDHPEVATVVNNLGSVLQDLGDLAGARAACERALRIFERFLPPEHPSIRTVRGNLEGLDRAGRGRE